MKIAVSIPDQELADAMRFPRARTSAEAVVIAVAELNRLHRCDARARLARTDSELAAVEEPARLRCRLHWRYGLPPSA